MAAEAGHLSFAEIYLAVACGEDSEVAADTGAVTGDLGQSALTNDDAAGVDSLTAVHFDTESLTG